MRVLKLLSRRGSSVGETRWLLTCRSQIHLCFLKTATALRSNRKRQREPKRIWGRSFAIKEMMNLKLYLVSCHCSGKKREREVESDTCEHANVHVWHGITLFRVSGWCLQWSNVWAELLVLKAALHGFDAVKGILDFLEAFKVLRIRVESWVVLFA